MSYRSIWVYIEVILFYHIYNNVVLDIIERGIMTWYFFMMNRE